MPELFSTLCDIDLASFCCGAEDPVGLEAELARSIAYGTVRPSWCWLARDRSGRVLALHNWWGRPHARRPTGVDLLGAESHDVAVAMVLHARDRLDVDEARSEVVISIDDGDDPSVVRAPLVAVLEASGFGFDVARVSVEKSLGGALGPRPGRLSFRAARGLDDDVLVALFASVGVDSLDHGMTRGRVRVGIEEEARQRLEAVRSYRGEPDWFSVAFTTEGEPVGYVVPGLAGDVPMVAEIGVAAAHRGRGYVDELLAWATAILATSGASRVVANTDRANAPMRAAFLRAGFRELRWRDDYSWRRSDDRRNPAAI